MRTSQNKSNFNRSLKIDMYKAYDSVEWPFLRQLLLKMGFSVNRVNKLYTFISSLSYQVVINGQHINKFSPDRGLRQGDPTAPTFS